MATGSTIRGSISSKDKRFFSSPKRPYQLHSPLSLLLNGYGTLFPLGLNRLGREADHRLHLLPSLGMHGCYLQSPICLHSPYGDNFVLIIIIIIIAKGLKNCQHFYLALRKESNKQCFALQDTTRSFMLCWGSNPVCHKRKD